MNPFFDNRTREAWVDFRGYLPERWTTEAARREAARVPETVELHTKPALAAQRPADAVEAGLPTR